MKYKSKLTFYFQYAHRLLHTTGKCKNIHGHNGVAIYTFIGDLSDERMLGGIDFTEIKEVIGNWIENTVDHAFILNREDSLLPLLENQTKLLKTNGDPTTENLCYIFFHNANEILKNIDTEVYWNLFLKSVEIQETPRNTAIYEI